MAGQLRRIRAMRRRHGAIVCREAVALVTDYLEDALSLTDRARLEAHLADCPNCREYFAQMRQTISASDHIEPEALPDGMRDELVRLYRAWRAG